MPRRVAFPYRTPASALLGRPEYDPGNAAFPKVFPPAVPQGLMPPVFRGIDRLHARRQVLGRMVIVHDPHVAWEVLLAERVDPTGPKPSDVGGQTSVLRWILAVPNL
jgi:hypothetical protein